MLRCGMVCGTTAWMLERCHETPSPDPLLSPRPRCVQESTKTKHPQLLYESKIYKILQGGSESALPLGLWRAAEAEQPACCSLVSQLPPLALPLHMLLAASRPIEPRTNVSPCTAAQPASPTSGGTVWRATTM